MFHKQSILHVLKKCLHQVVPTLNGQTVLTATIIRALPMNLHVIPAVNYQITVVLTHSTDCTSSAVTASKSDIQC